MAIPSDIIRISDSLWELPVEHKPGMRVPARIYGSPPLLAAMDEAVFEQISNVAMLPGIQRYAFCMPDGHCGYGFPIGGVAAVDLEQGVISPGGIGFDINCGMRLILTNLTAAEVRPFLPQLVDKLFSRVPAGVGSSGFVRLSHEEFRTVLQQGARWAVEKGYGWQDDLERTEEGGCIGAAQPSLISPRAVERGLRQIGTLGSGNHYLEIQQAREGDIFDRQLAAAFGISRPDQVVIMFHCGSRGFGHQVASDYLQLFLAVMQRKYGLSMPDRELACAPFFSAEGQAYFGAMKCAINMSFANRQVIAHRIREVFAEVFHRDPHDLGMRQVYDVAHNTAKIEEHLLEGRRRRLLVHRKGSTRAFGPGMYDLPPAYAATGQPVIIGGSIETGSYLLAGLASGAETFFSTAHGSGRLMSRTRARHEFHGQQIRQQLLDRGVYVRTASFPGLAEEAGPAYKDVDQIVAATELAGISKRVVRFSPIGNIKG